MKKKCIFNGKLKEMTLKVRILQCLMVGDMKKMRFFINSQLRIILFWMPNLKFKLWTESNGSLSLSLFFAKAHLTPHNTFFQQASVHRRHPVRQTIILGFTRWIAWCHISQPVSYFIAVFFHTYRVSGLYVHNSGG